MPWFKVTTAETVYETYEFEAATEGLARQRVREGEGRIGLPSFDAGTNDDVEVIHVLADGS